MEKGCKKRLKTAKTVHLAAIIGYFCFIQSYCMRIYIIVICLFISAVAMAQPKSTVQYTMTKEELMAKRKELQDDIAETEKRLRMISNDKQTTMSQLRDLQNKLALRQRLISNINDEMNDIDRTIRNSSKEVGNLKTKLEELKIRYAQSIRYSYQSRSSYDMIAFLFSSRDFNDALRRMKYLKKFRDFRKQQVEQIKTTQSTLQHKIGVLASEKQQKDKLLNTEEEQKKYLMEETDHTNRVIEDLKGKEGELMKNVEKNRVIAKRVNAAINRIIENEIAKAAKEAEEAEKKRIEEEKKKTAALTTVPAPPTKTETPRPAASNNPPPADIPTRPRPVRESQPLLLTPTDVALAENFEGNMGKLYWPVDKGFISDHFGTHPHPIETRVMIENTGVDIQTSADAPVRAVFDGTVTSVSYIAGNMMVLIKHGNYFTVYNNMKSASVKKDEQVKARQQIGIVALNDEGEPTIKFQIWKAMKKGSVKLNPETWLGRAR
ncbi:MAG: Peptidase [Flavipsychrobacter sp.]|nr:Peptidase [Flavipsychrobacter sp.]